MNPVDTAAATTDTIVGLPAGFMIDGATYERGGALGFEGVDFYVGGRGGALGEVDGLVVAAAFVFFNPVMVTEAWERAQKVSPPGEAALAFAGCAHAWADAHLPDGIDYARLSELERRLVAESSPASAPLFAAWAAQPEPSSPKALALHRMNVLRELRGALHGCAVLGQGLSPLEALAVKTPFMAGIFGWNEPLPDPEPHKDAWERAEEATNRAMARAFAVLGEEGRDEFVELISATQSG